MNPLCLNVVIIVPFNVFVSVSFFILLLHNKPDIDNTRQIKTLQLPYTR